jgi:hypothetical protein
MADQENLPESVTDRGRPLARNVTGQLLAEARAAHNALARAEQAALEVLTRYSEPGDDIRTCHHPHASRPQTEAHRLADKLGPTRMAHHQIG